MPELSKTNWETIVRQTKRGKLLPIVSARVTHRYVFDHPEFIQAWSDYMDYPLGRSLSITRLAQYLSVTEGYYTYKQGFLDFTKRHLYRSATAGGANDEELAAIKEQLYDLSLSDLIAQIKPAVLEDHVNHPLRGLAELPIPVYITTCYFDLLEKALERVGKTPQPKTYRWDKEALAASQRTTKVLYGEMIDRLDLEELQTICDIFLDSVEFDDLAGESRDAKARELIKYMDNRKKLPELIGAIREARPDFELPADLVSLAGDEPDYKPSTDEPLVYHLFGLEEEPQSLILSEDDYLQFLIDWAQDSPQREFISLDLRMAMEESSLILLGYDLQDWDFRVLFHSLITGKRPETRPMSVAIQLSPEVNKDDKDKAQHFVERYLDTRGNNFRIYWGSTESFLEELSAHWETEL